MAETRPVFEWPTVGGATGPFAPHRQHTKPGSHSSTGPTGERQGNSGPGLRPTLIPSSESQPNAVPLPPNYQVTGTGVALSSRPAAKPKPVVSAPDSDDCIRVREQLRKCEAERKQGEADCKAKLIAAAAAWQAAVVEKDARIAALETRLQGAASASKAADDARKCKADLERERKRAQDAEGKLDAAEDDARRAKRELDALKKECATTKQQLAAADKLSRDAADKLIELDLARQACVDELASRKGCKDELAKLKGADAAARAAENAIKDLQRVVDDQASDNKDCQELLAKLRGALEEAARDIAIGCGDAAAAELAARTRCDGQIDALRVEYKRRLATEQARCAAEIAALQERLSTAERNAKTDAEEMARLREKLAQVDSKGGDCEELVAVLKSRIEALQAQITSTRAAESELKRSNERLSDEVAKCRTETGRVRREMEADVRIKTDEVDDLRLQLEAAEANIVRLRAAVAEGTVSLQMQLDSHLQACVALKRRLSAAEAELAAAKSKAAGTTDALEIELKFKLDLNVTLTARVAELETLVAKLEARIAQLQTEHGSATDVVRIKAELVVQLQLELEQERANIARLRAENDAARRLELQIKLELEADLLLRIEQAQADLAAAQSRAAGTTGELERDLQVKLDLNVALTAQVAELKAQLEAERARCGSATDELRIDVRAKSEAVARLTVEVKNAEARLADASANAEDRNRLILRLDRARADLATANADLATANAELADARARLQNQSGQQGDEVVYLRFLSDACDAFGVRQTEPAADMAAVRAAWKVQVDCRRYLVTGVKVAFALLTADTPAAAEPARALAEFCTRHVPEAAVRSENIAACVSALAAMEQVEYTTVKTNPPQHVLTGPRVPKVLDEDLKDFMLDVVEGHALNVQRAAKLLHPQRFYASPGAQDSSQGYFSRMMMSASNIHTYVTMVLNGGVVPGTQSAPHEKRIGTLYKNRSGGGTQGDVVTWGVLAAIVTLAASVR